MTPTKIGRLLACGTLGIESRELTDLCLSWLKQRESLEFSNMMIEHAIALGYLGEGSTLGMAKDALTKNNEALQDESKESK